MMEKEVTVGIGGKYPLKGILSLPDNCNEKVPAVVLVHGSGSTDMDETVWGNKPFKNIADYLPSKEIAVLRYNKRIFVYEVDLWERENKGCTKKI